MKSFHLRYNFFYYPENVLFLLDGKSFSFLLTLENKVIFTATLLLEVDRRKTYLSFHFNNGFFFVNHRSLGQKAFTSRYLSIKREKKIGYLNGKRHRFSNINYSSDNFCLGDHLYVLKYILIMVVHVEYMYQTAYAQCSSRLKHRQPKRETQSPRLGMSVLSFTLRREVRLRLHFYVFEHARTF